MDSGRSDPGGESNDGVFTPAATITRSAGMNPSDESTPVTRSLSTVIVSAATPSRIVAPCDRANRAYACVALIGLACPSLGQYEAERTLRDIAGATARIAALSDRKWISRPSVRWVDT